MGDVKIVIAHDFSCPWCWIGLHQARRLQAELGVELDWRGYELFPEELDWPEARPKPEVNPNRPATPSRLALAYAAEDMDKATNYGPDEMRTHDAHEAVEFAKTLGVHEALLDRLYTAHWTEAADLSDHDTLRRLAEGIVPDVDEMMAAIAEKRFEDQIVGFDDDAYAAGVYNVPTFFIQGERYAEQPYRVLRAAVLGE